MSLYAYGKYLMTLLSILSATDVQKNLAAFVQRKRKQLKLSRPSLAKRSTVPVATIKKFETTGQISLRQFILLWQCVDSLQSLNELTQEVEKKPRSIKEVLGR